MTAPKQRKRCYKCGKEKPVEDFHANTSRCRPCQKVYQKNRKKAKRKKTFNQQTMSKIEELIRSQSMSFGSPGIGELNRACMEVFGGPKGIAHLMRAHLQKCDPGSGGAIKILDMVKTVMVKTSELKQHEVDLNQMTMENVELYHLSSLAEAMSVVRQRIESMDEQQPVVVDATPLVVPSVLDDDEGEADE